MSVSSISTPKPGFSGDGRNNYNDPRLDIAREMQRKGRRLIWFCPEPRRQWGSGSDMWEYSMVADKVFLVNNLLADGGRGKSTAGGWLAVWSWIIQLAQVL